MKKLLALISILLLAFCNISCAKNGIEFTEHKKGLYILKIDTNLHEIVPHVEEDLKTNAEVFKQLKPLAVINGGYFDASNQKTTSYVFINSLSVADPLSNENLVKNSEIVKNINNVLNRSEFRVLNCGGKIEYDIDRHNEFPKLECYVVHSLQAGPQIMPFFMPEEEYFIETKNGEVTRDPIHVFQKVPRTAVGIKDNFVYFIIASKEYPMSLADLKDLADELDIDKMLNLDGGGSTSLNYKDKEIVSEKEGKGRKVKSFLIVR